MRIAFIQIPISAYYKPWTISASPGFHGRAEFGGFGGNYARMLLTAIVLIATAGPRTWCADLALASELYQRSDYHAALRELKSATTGEPEALFLSGKIHYMLGDYKEAVNLLTEATQRSGSESSYFNWLGKSYGRLAESAGIFSAPRYASRCRQAFEKAVELGPANLEALSDLMEYYLEAHGFLGGGLAQAESLVPRIETIDSAQGHYARSRLAEKRKDYGAAEQQLRRAAELAPRQVGRLIDLARFLARHGRLKESEQVFVKAAKIAPASPKLLFARAKSYIETRQNVDEARRLLVAYLKSPLTPDDPPRRDAERLLESIGGG